MERALKPFLILPWASGRQLRLKRRRGVLHKKGTIHQGTTITQSCKLQLPVSNGTVSIASISLQHAGLRRDTDALYSMRQVKRVESTRTRAWLNPRQKRTSLTPLPPPLL
jgi:hypothetical protein